MHTKNGSLMRILYYNWVQFDDADRRGGGVTVYQNNVIREMVRLGHDVTFFSSGLAYSLLKGEAFIRKTTSLIPECKTFEIVNSSVMAPSHSFWGGDEIVLNDHSMDACMKDFVRTHGPFDVVHFQNLEGIPVSLVSKEIFGNARLLHSAHNYYSVCPQVNLWRYETANCKDYNSGQSCTYCLPVFVSLKRNMAQAQMHELLSLTGVDKRSKQFSVLLGQMGKAKPLCHLFNRIKYQLYLRKSENPIWSFIYGKKSSAELRFFATRRSKISEAFRRNSVTTIAVSERTRDVIARFGLAENDLVTAYIGTEHADRFASTMKLSAPRSFGRFNIAYLGYMRHDKGSYFFIECLERIPRALAASIDVVIAAKDDGDGSLSRLMQLNTKFGSVTYYDGFTSTELDFILRDTDLGIIPSLWEDNLPQVAIEIVSRGIPILTSDLGGPQEIARSPDFVFKSNNHLDFLRTFRRIATGEIALSRFWESAPRLLSMSDHSMELLRIYRTLAPTGVLLPGGDADGATTGSSDPLAVLAVDEPRAEEGAWLVSNAP